MPERLGEAVWEGDLSGQGKVSLGSGAFSGPYSAKSRFENEEGTPGTNPEELIGAAHAACYSMALSVGLARAGHIPTRVHTKARVHLERLDSGFSITRIDLTTEAEVPGIGEDAFQEEAARAKVNCPVSMALAGTEIALDAKLI